MKKIILVCVCFLNLIPHIENWMIKFDGPETVFAQTQSTGTERTNKRSVDDDPCQGIQSTFDNSYNGDVHEESGYLATDVDTGNTVFIANPDDGNTANSSDNGTITAKADGNNYINMGTQDDPHYYQVQAEVHSHPNTGTDPNTGDNWDPGPSPADFDWLDNMNVNNHNLYGITLSADGHAYKFSIDDDGNQITDDLGSMSQWLTDNGCP